MIKWSLIIIGLFAYVGITTVLFLNFMVWLHDFLDSHGIQDKRCREADRELGRPQKKPSWRAQ